MKKSLGNNVLPHYSYRKGQAGFVELWPLFETEKETDKNFWEAPIKIKESNSGAAKLANQTGLQTNQVVETTTKKKRRRKKKKRPNKK